MSDKNKKLYTREEFAGLLRDSATAMAADAELRREALGLLIRADQHRWVHQTSWMGEPILNLPQDMFALQEIIYRTRPRFIVEVGVAWGGAMLFYSTLMEIVGGDRIIGVDVFIPEDLKKRLESHEKLARRFTLIQGSSVDDSIFQRVKSIIGDSREVMVVLDSHHTHEHVLRELRLYSELVGKGQYLICGDTIIEDLPTQEHRPRPWGPGNNPKTALAEFLRGNSRFEVDHNLENKLLLTCNPGGYLRCVTD